VAVLVGLALFVYPGILRHSTRTASTAGADLASLSLRVERTGTDILLTWNRDSAAIQHANHGLLSISDGDRHENYDMDLGQLRNGSIVYSPLTADVSFRMEVTGANNVKTASESVRVLRTRPSPMPDGSQPPVDTAKAGVKPGSPANSAAPGTPADEASAEEPAAPAAKPLVPSKPFNTDSLAQRLRPATAAETPMPEAPALNSNVAVPTSVPNIGGTGVTAAPFVPAAPAPAAPERRAAAASSSPTGGKISQAQVVTSKQPEYPKLARQLGVKGSVELIATIGADGHVKSVKIEKGHPLLIKAASDAVMQWVYRPTLLNGVPVQNDTHITLNFMGDK
jgi:periplasmic protein TonB